MQADEVKKVKPKYEVPTVESEEIFERRALACGKCKTGPIDRNKTSCKRYGFVS